MDEPAAAPQAPAVEQFALIDRFAHAGAAEHDRFRQQKPRIVREIDLDAPPQLGPVEQDGFLRQPGDCGARADGEPHDRRSRPGQAHDRPSRRPQW